MTFIATVIAKKGAALIADSLVTTSRQVLEFDDFYDYLSKKNKDNESGEIKIDTAEVINLFVTKPSHTKDYQEKLFEYERFIAISTAGAANLNDKSLEQIINEAKAKFTNRDQLTLDEKISQLKGHFNEEAVQSLKNGNAVRNTVLIITNYNPETHLTKVYKLEINETRPAELEDNIECVSINEQPEISTVVCEGQNRISEKILWGDLETVVDFIPRVARKIFKDFNIDKDKIPPNYIEELWKDKDILHKAFWEDIKIGKLRELSMQQAIDFACLLMKIERDIQKYTENIPTVGGNVKIAIIDDNGFRFISGEDIIVKDF